MGSTESLPLAGSRALELGSGPGLTTDWLLPRVASLTAVEYEADAGALRSRSPDVEVHHADATALPFDEETFDVVVCFTMLHHVPTPEMQDKVLAEARRVLRPGGAFGGSDSRWGPLFAVAHWGDTLQLVDPERFESRLLEAGFATASVDPRRDVIRFRAVAAG